MAARKQNKGACVFCQKEMTKSGLSKHFSSCTKRQQAVAKANEKAKSGKEQTLFYLVIEDKYAKDFWLHLEMKGTAKIDALDHYLREIWLECCGHLSAFQYKRNGRGGEQEISLSRQAKTVFEVGLELEHIYDFGSSSETLIKVIAERQGQALSKHPIKLLARNEMPETYCIECGQPASWYCQECVIEEDEPGLLCDEHVKTHPHDNYGEPLPLANSPRMGICGYDGPAIPPY